MDKIIIYATFADEDAAKRITTALLEARLVACANVMPCESHYWWEGKIECQPEIRAVYKSTAQCFEDVKNLITKLHPYSVPAIVAVAISHISQPYGEWISNEINPL